MFKYCHSESDSLPHLILMSLLVWYTSRNLSSLLRSLIPNVCGKQEKEYENTVFPWSWKHNLEEKLLIN